jgi:hypothetical protein
MSAIILWIVGIIFLLAAWIFLIVEGYRMKRSPQDGAEDKNKMSGPEKVTETLHTVVRILLKRSVYVRKFCMQYVLHVMVRGMYYFDIITRKMYEVSRNWFVRNAVKNKGTVPHFWEHLKTYKQEMDKEKEREEGIR